MSAPRTGIVAATLARIEDFLLEPAEPTQQAECGAVVETVPPQPHGPRPVIAVFGLARRCGATTVARALAAELAARDPDGAGAVASPAASGGLRLATPAARALAERLEDVPGAATSAVGRLCLVEGADRDALVECARHYAPLVLDPGHVEIGDERRATDRILLVTTPRLERALAAAAVACLRRGRAEPVLVVNMVRAAPASASAAVPARVPAIGAAAAIQLPFSRTGAQLALGGRQPRGELGRAVAALAELCA
jgi:hypothetical protein